MPYHITHRGNGGGAVFDDDADRVAYLALLSANAARFGLNIWAYCLMPNHIHLIVNGTRVSAMAQGIGLTHRKHAARLNRRRGQSGHLWANRFFSTPLDEDHLWAAVRYVELNPVRARMVSHPIDYEWSSARSHATGMIDRVLDPCRPFPGPIEHWLEWLLSAVDEERWEAIRRNTLSGRPSGSLSFAKDLERRMGRTLLTKNRGPQPRINPGEDGP